MPANRRTFERLVMATLVGTFILMMLGGYVKAIGAGLACPDWPQCYGTWYPFSGGAIPPAEQGGYPVDMVMWEWIHRFVAAFLGPFFIGLAVMSWYLRPVERGIRFFATAGLVLIPIQYLLGRFTVTAFLEPVIVISHLGTAILIFSCYVVTATLAFTSPHRSGAVRADADARAGAPAAEAEPAGSAPGPMSSRPWTARLQQALGPWFELIKPGILFLLVLCGAAAMFLATEGMPDLKLVGVTLLGGGLAASSAAAFNNYLDRDRDALLARTRKRSIPSHRIPPRAALGFAFVLEALSFAILWRYANLLTAFLALAGILFYVYYTIWLKPSTVQNIVIGGAAGAAPALVGWAAVTGELGIPALLLGFIIFAWTPPHFWALALVYKDDYAKGAVPMHPVVKGETSTRRQILAYAILTVVATLLFVPLGVLGLVYGVVALLLGAWFVAMAAKLLVKKDNKTAYGLFAYSIVYLALLFGAMVVDRLV